MNLFDIIGPAMVGPSSSHTAGAARIGLIARKLLNEDVANADIRFHGSFEATGKGHGTDRALIAGLLGMDVDDARIPDSFQYARQRGLHFSFHAVDLGEEAHPNSVLLDLSGKNGRRQTIIASSIGGGRIRVNEIDGLKAEFSGDHPTLIVQNDDTPGVVANITTCLANAGINIATMQLDRDARGGKAVFVVECDQEIDRSHLEWLNRQDGVLKVTYLRLEQEEN